MASFTVRIELQGALFNDYELLHQLMARQGFTRTIKGNDGRVHLLPQAEYNLESEQDFTAEQVRDTVIMLAQALNRPHYVIVTKALERAWILPQIPQIPN